MTVDPSFVPAWVRSATIARAEGRFDDARSLLERALQLHPGDAAATKTLGEFLVAQKRPDLALPFSDNSPRLRRQVNRSPRWALRTSGSDR